MKARATELTLLRDAAALADAACSEIVKLAHGAIASRGAFHVALSGGPTLRATYERLARAAWTAEFARWHVWFADERCVPPDHAESNFRMLREALFDRVEVPRERVHRMRGEAADAREAADDYERELVGMLGSDGPRFDLVLLGLGADGHTAALFPGTDALRERERLVVANWVEHLGAHRLTLTPRAINCARRVSFLVSGAAKSGALHAAFAGDPDAPTSSIAPPHGRVHWLADRAAAAKLGLEFD